jgi:hypothetical protein
MAGPLRRRGGQQRMHNVVMRGAKDQPRTRGSHRLWLEQHVQLSRGHWRREEGAGAIRSAGWRESVTVTWLSTTTPERRPGCCTALATTFDTIAPSIAELTAATARRSLERRHRTHTAFPSSRGTCPTPPGTSPVRPGPLTGVVSAGRARCCGGRGPMKKLIVVLAACARQVGEPTDAKPRGSAWRERTPGHMCSCARS